MSGNTIGSCCLQIVVVIGGRSIAKAVAMRVSGKTIKEIAVARTLASQKVTEKGDP